MADNALTAAALAEVQKAHAAMRGLVTPYWSWVPVGIAQQINAIFAQLADAEVKLTEALKK